jgi:tetratricopeptide (TPR) repeat protein
MKDNGPILESRHHEGLQPKRKNPIVFIVAGLLFIIVLTSFFFIMESDRQEQDFYEEIEAQIQSEEELEQKLHVEDSSETKSIEKEEKKTASFYYQRALTYESENNYKEAVADYTQTVTLSNKYSSEMFNALNNGGIIKAQQFEHYKSALKDFDRIINVEINRIDGDINSTRLEAGYTNRAYVKKMQGDIEGACDDLYEALSLGVVGSEDFIEKQIEKNCL